MKTILFFIFLSGCGLNESLVNSIGEQAKDVIDKAKSQGGQKGIQTLNDEIEDLEEKIDKKESEYRRLKNRIDDKEEELDEKQDELDDVEKRLREIEDRLNEGGLTPEEIQALKDERDRLQGDKTTLEQEKQRLQDQINGLNTDKEQLEAERDQAKADLEAVKQARDDLQRQLSRTKRERDNARESASQAGRERDCWKQTKFNFCTSHNAELKTAVLAELGLADSECDEVNICHLRSINTLRFRGNGDKKINCGNTQTPHNPPSFFSEDFFEDLSNLRELDLSGRCLTYLRDRNDFDFFIPATVRRINLTNTGVDRLPRNFVFPDSIREVTVSDFIYCGNEPLPSYVNKLKPSSIGDRNRDYVKAHNDPYWMTLTETTTSLPEDTYCY